MVELADSRCTEASDGAQCNPAAEGPLSLCELNASYGSEGEMPAAIFKWRWPDGFVCPACGSRDHAIVGARAISVPRLPEADLAQIRHYFCAHAAAVRQMVPGHVSAHAVEELGLDIGAGAPSWCAARHGIDAPQADVGDVRARGEPAKLDGRVEMDDAVLGGEKKRAGWRQTWAFGAQQDPFRRGRRDQR